MVSSSGITKNDFYLGIGLFWFLGFAVMLIVLIAFGPTLGCDLGLKACHKLQTLSSFVLVSEQ